MNFYSFTFMFLLTYSLFFFIFYFFSAKLPQQFRITEHSNNIFSDVLHPYTEKHFCVS